MWDLPGPGIEPVFPALAGGFLTTAPPGKSPLEGLNCWIQPSTPFASFRDPKLGSEVLLGRERGQRSEDDYVTVCVLTLALALAQLLFVSGPTESWDCSGTEGL